MQIIDTTSLLEAVSGISMDPVERQKRMKRLQDIPVELVEIAIRESSKPEFLSDLSGKQAY